MKYKMQPWEEHIMTLDSLIDSLAVLKRTALQISAFNADYDQCQHTIALVEESIRRGFANLDAWVGFWYGQGDEALAEELLGVRTLLFEAFTEGRALCSLSAEALGDATSEALKKAANLQRGL